MNYYDARTKRLTIYDGREVAPAQATESMFLGPDGKALPFGTAVLSGRATGVPGVIKMLGVAHGEHGKLPWSSLFGDARRTARRRLHRQPAAWTLHSQRRAREWRARRARLFLEAGRHVCSRPAIRLRNPAYAEFLGRLAAQGPAAFYAGSTAARIVARTRAAPLGGSMTMADLANYKPVKREPLVPPLPSLSGLRPAAAVERRRPAAASDDARADRHRGARTRRPASLVPVRRGEPHHVRRPRPLCRRSGLRVGAGRRACSTPPMSRRGRG